MEIKFPTNNSSLDSVKGSQSSSSAASMASRNNSTNKPLLDDLPLYKVHTEYKEDKKYDAQAWMAVFLGLIGGLTSSLAFTGFGLIFLLAGLFCCGAGIKLAYSVSVYRKSWRALLLPCMGFFLGVIVIFVLSYLLSWGSLAVLFTQFLGDFSVIPSLLEIHQLYGVMVSATGFVMLCLCGILYRALQDPVMTLGEHKATCGSDVDQTNGDLIENDNLALMKAQFEGQHGDQTKHNNERSRSL